MALRLGCGGQPRIVLVTCNRWPDLSPSDQCYAAALRAIGAQVAIAAWNSTEAQPGFREAELVVIRGAWDYHEAVHSYRDWLAQLAGAGITVLNDPALIGRFLDKTAFTALAGDDVTTPRCRVCPADRDAIAGVLATEGWDRAVLKPVHGASGRGVTLVTRQTVDEALDAVTSDVGERSLLVQAFIPEIAEGETQFVLFDGTVSHAVLKRPRAGEFRTNSVFAPDLELLDPLPAATGRIEALVRRMGVRPLYTRVDVVMRGAVPVLLEFEVNEPGLWLDLAPPSAAEAFARATMARMRG